MRAAERALKIVFLAVVLIAASAVPPAFAKEAHARRAHRPAVAASPKADAGKAAKSEIRAPRGAGGKRVNASSGEGTNAKSAAPVDFRHSDAIETPAAATSPRPGLTLDKGRDVNARSKITTPGNLRAHRVTVPGPSSPVARNAIGVPAAQHDAITGSGGERIGPAMPAAGRALSGTESNAKPSGGFGGPITGPQHPAPIASASIASRGRIEGTGLIRPALAPTGLGGPAKAVAGINGTTLRPKR